jgi:hypothetical protein
LRLSLIAAASAVAAVVSAEPTVANGFLPQVVIRKGRKQIAGHTEGNRIVKKDGLGMFSEKGKLRGRVFCGDVQFKLEVVNIHGRSQNQRFLSHVAPVSRLLIEITPWLTIII